MKEERRKDYVELAIHANDIKYMKESLDELKRDLKEFLTICKEEKEKLTILQLKVSWLLKGIAAFFASLGAGLIYFKAKLIALFTLL